MNDYILQISFDAADAALEERVQSALYLTSSSGSTSSEAAGTTTVEAYFDSVDTRDAAAELFRSMDVDLGRVERPRVDWLAHYEQSLRAIEAGRRFIVAPAASLIPDGTDRLRIVVPQEQAFGTGSHETTALCLELLETVGVDERRGLDIGAGSGILAIGMHRLGAAKVIAFDNDTDAYGALRDNRMRNGVPESAMPLFIGSVEALRGGEFDVVTMNILPDVIVALLPGVVPRLAAGAALIVSGVLTLRRDDVVAAARAHGLTVASERVKGEWWAAVLKR